MSTNSYFSSLFIIVLQFVFMAPLLGHASAPHRKFVYVPIRMSWFRAREYCREHHTDLATFRTLEEITGLNVPCSFASKCWIGFHEVDLESWIWSDGEETTFTNFNILFLHQIQPAEKDCASLATIYWYPLPCGKEIPFLCYERLILVKKKMTWEEALEHCMARHKHSTDTGVQSHYSLAYVEIGGVDSEARRTVLEAETDEVWIGLRFLAGYWLWMNGNPLQEQLPACPQMGKYCGAMSKTGQLLPENDCLERRNFFCSEININ